MSDKEIEWAEKPFDLKVAIISSDGRINDRLVEAWMVNGTGKQFAVHLDINYGPFKNTWNVSHVGSGSGLTFSSGSRQTAARRAQIVWKMLPAPEREVLKGLKFGQNPKYRASETLGKLVEAWGGCVAKNKLPEVK